MALDKIHKRHALWIEIIVVVLILVSAAQGVAPSEQWNKTFGETGHDLAYSVQQIADGGYILAGTANLNPQSGNPNAWLIKTDTNGNQQWNKTFGLTTSNAPPVVQKTSDGGFVLGISIYDGAGTFKIQIIKFDINGNLQWSKTFGKTDTNETYLEFVNGTAVRTIDGGYIAAGSSSYSGSSYAQLIKTDTNGNMQWSKQLRGPCIFHGTQCEAQTWAYSVQQTSDGGYILAGEVGVGSGGSGWLVKTDSNGNEQWNKTFPGPYGAKIFSVRQTSDGGYVLAGMMDPSGGSPKAWLIKISKDESYTTTPIPSPTPIPTTPIQTPTPTPTITQITTPTPTSTSPLEQEIKELKERLNKTEEKQSQQESRISWLESAINSIIDWLKSIF